MDNYLCLNMGQSVNIILFCSTYRTIQSLALFDIDYWVKVSIKPCHVVMPMVSILSKICHHIYELNYSI
jgi:hypothetical protein